MPIGDRVGRRRNAEGGGRGNQFDQQIHQGVTHTVVADASRHEQKFHDVFPCRLNESRKAPLAPYLHTEAERPHNEATAYLPIFATTDALVERQSSAGGISRTLSGEELFRMPLLIDLAKCAGWTQR